MGKQCCQLLVLQRCVSYYKWASARLALGLMSCQIWGALFLESDKTRCSKHSHRIPSMAQYVCEVFCLCWLEKKKKGFISSTVTVRLYRSCFYFHFISFKHLWHHWSLCFRNLKLCSRSFKVNWLLRDCSNCTTITFINQLLYRQTAFICDPTIEGFYSKVLIHVGIFHTLKS